MFYSTGYERPVSKTAVTYCLLQASGEANGRNLHGMFGIKGFQQIDCKESCPPPRLALLDVYAKSYWKFLVSCALGVIDRIDDAGEQSVGH